MSNEAKRIIEGPKPQVLQNSWNLDQVVSAMNGDNDLGMSREGIAAYYAIDAQLDSGYPLDDAAIEAHLDTLREAGANFDYQQALSIAKEAAAEGWVWDDDQEENIRWDVATHLMDDDLREELNLQSWESNQEYYDAYKAAHRAKFDEDFEVN